MLVWGSLPLSLLAGGFAQGLIAVAAPAFAQHWFRQPVVLLAVHLGTLGMLLLTLMAVLTQFMPMLLGQSFAFERVIAPLLVFLALAVLGVWAFLAGLRDSGLAWGAGLSVCAAAAAFGVLALPAFIHGGVTHRLSRATLASALFYLFFTVLLGSLLAQGLVHPPLIQGDPFALIALHLHLGLFGFGCLAVFGVSYELLPMFNLAKGVVWRSGWLALGFGHLGLLLLALRTLGPPWAEALGSAWAWPLAASVLAYLWQVRQLLAKALRRHLEANGVQFRLAWTALGLVVPLGLVLAVSDALQPGLHAAYVYLLLYGFLGGAIFSQLQKIGPLLAWYDRFAPLAGTAAVPSAAQLLQPQLAWATPILHGASLATTTLVSTKKK
jgi:hypothetical protein